MKVLDIINKSKGKIFSAVFLKKDGTIRRMNCRLNVNKGVNGKGMSYDPIKKGLLPVYDMDKKGFRMINMNTLISFKVNGKSYNTDYNKKGLL